jgi:hypothetical protein
LPYPADYRPAFAFSGILCLLARPPSLRSGYHPKVGAMRFTQLIGMEMRHGEVGPYSPVGHPGAAAGKDSSGGPSHTAFRRQRPVSLFGRFGVTSPETGLHVLQPSMSPLATTRPEAGRPFGVVPGASHLELLRSMSG